MQQPNNGVRITLRKTKMNKFNILLFIGLIGCSSPSISQNGSDASFDVNVNVKLCCKITQNL